MIKTSGNVLGQLKFWINLAHIKLVLIPCIFASFFYYSSVKKMFSSFFSNKKKKEFILIKATKTSQSLIFPNYYIYFFTEKTLTSKIICIEWFYPKDILQTSSILQIFQMCLNFF